MEEEGEEVLVRLARPANFDDSYDSESSSGEEQEWVPLLRRQNAIRRGRVGTIDDSFVAYQNPFVEVTLRFSAWLEVWCPLLPSPCPRWCASGPCYCCSRRTCCGSSSCLWPALLRAERGGH